MTPRSLAATALLGAALFTMRPGPLGGQSPPPAAPNVVHLATDPNDRTGSHYAWGTVELFLNASRFRGLEVTVFTISRMRGAAPHGFAGSFPPDSVLDWLNLANAVSHPSADPTDPHSQLATPVLRAANGDSLFLIRKAKSHRWDKRIAIVFASAKPDREPFAISAKPDEVDDLLHGMLREASGSGFVRDSALLAPQDVVLAEAQADIPPALLHAGPLVYPDHSLAGSVTVGFIVDETGIPLASSIHIIAADHVEFGEWARSVILESRFRPARIHDRPVAVWVQQRIHYSQ